MRRNVAGFAPDLDTEIDGVVIDCMDYIPTNKGFTAANSRQSTTLPALAAAATGAYVGKLLDATKRLMVSTATKIYEASTSSWTDRSRVGNYSGANPTRFTMFGNFILSTNRSEVIQACPSGSNFADIAGAPAAAIIDSCAGFVMALNTSDGTYGDRPDGWWCSGLYDHTTWAPASSTQAANGRLVDTPGALTAGRALGRDFVAYKADSMYLGRYVGLPIIWDWQRIPGTVGCASHEAVVSVNNAHYFVGAQNIYVFDGATVQPIGDKIARWFFSQLNNTYKNNIRGIADASKDLIYWYYPTASSTLDACIVYNYVSGEWGRISGSIQAPVDFISGQITWDNLGTLGSTWDDLPQVTYDSGFWLADSTQPAIIDTTNTLRTLTGAPTSGYFTVGDVGDLVDYTFLKRVSPRYRITPTTSNAINSYADTLYGPWTVDATAQGNKNRFDFRRSAHFHRVQINTTGSCAVTGVDFTINAASPE